MDAALVPALTLVATVLAVAACSRLFPDPRDRSADPLSDDERQTFRRWEVAALVPIFVLIPALAWAWYRALTGAAGLVPPSTPATRFLLRPTPMLWGVFALLLGIVSASLPMHWLYQTLLGDRYPRYTRFCDERARYDGWRTLGWLACLVLVGTGVIFFLVTRTYARFEAHRVEIGRPFALRAATYDYRRVTAIEHRATFVAPSGRVIHRPHHVFRFDDGTAWNAETTVFRDPVPALDAKIAELVSRRSGRPIVEVP